MLIWFDQRIKHMSKIVLSINYLDFPKRLNRFPDAVTQHGEIFAQHAKVWTYQM